MKAYKAMNARVGSVHDLDKSNYIYEPKLDGVRALCFIDSKVRLISRNGLDLTHRYPELQHIKEFIHAQSCILDGEIVSFDKKGVSRFELLQEGKPAFYGVFDILMKNGKDLRQLPLMERKKILDETLTDDANIKKLFFTQQGSALLKEMKKIKGEGVMAKEMNGTYHSGERSKTWLKIKFHNTLDCVIVGYETKIRRLSALGLGLYDGEKKLHYIGKVGTGFSEELISTLLKLLKPLEIDHNPTVTEGIKKLHFVKPHVTCEVKYEELTKSKKVRQAAFIRLRPDKKSHQCTLASQ